MSHELRTPLNAIVGFTQLLKISPGLDAVERDNVVEIEKAGAFLLELISEILDLSRVESGKLTLSEEHVDLAALAQECVQLVAPIAAQKNIRLDVHIDRDSLLLADQVRLKQILLNLLSNAIRYNRDGGDVGLHGLRAADNKLRLEIRDSGVGIAAEHLQTIFTPFNRLGAGSIEGSGIGLLITRRLVALMQGEIGVFSLPGRGSVFWVELPRRRLSVLESMLRDIEPQCVAASNAAIAWIGERSPLFDALERLQELRPTLQLFYYLTPAALAADASAEPRRVFVTQNAAAGGHAQALAKQLKGAQVHVVMDQSECRNPSAGDSVQTTVCGDVHEDIRLTALLALLDDTNRAYQP
jgi:hypothetical protein